jgi:hypothetical protein
MTKTVDEILSSAFGPMSEMEVLEGQDIETILSRLDDPLSSQSTCAEVARLRSENLALRVTLQRIAKIALQA